MDFVAIKIPLFDDGKSIIEDEIQWIVNPYDESAIEEALQLSTPDFEDSVTAAAARLAGCDYIVTRDPKGFRGSPVRSLTPEMAAPLLGKA